MTKDKTVTMSREQFQAANPVPYGVFWSEPDSRYMTSMVHLNCLEYQGKWLGWQSAILATPVVERQDAPFYISTSDWNTLVRSDVEIASVRISRTKRSIFTEPLHASPPAPVSVNVRMADILQSLRTNANPALFAPGQLAEVDACLDKVKELNQ